MHLFLISFTGNYIFSLRGLMHYAKGSHKQIQSMFQVYFVSIMEVKALELYY